MELQKHHPELKVRTYGAPVVDLKGAMQPNWNANAERYINFGDPISMFDPSAHNGLPAVLLPKSTHAPVSEQRQTF